MTREEMREVAGDAAEAALSRMLLILGVDASDPKSMIELQTDLAHIRKWRKSMEKVSTVTLGTAITFVVSGLAAMLWVGFKLAVGRG